MKVKGQVISGNYAKILCRQKSSENLELGELLASEDSSTKIILQVTDLEYASQISQQNLELIAGMKLEQNVKEELLEPELRNYVIATLKPLVTVRNDKVALTKTLPPFFSELRAITSEDMKFITSSDKPLPLGALRSGSKKLDVEIKLEGDKVLSHHVLISGSTGKGKSVLMKNLIWDITSQEYAALLVLDPHNEYYGTHGKGMKDHEIKVKYYTSRNPPPGQNTLKLALQLVKPEHVDFLDFSQPQSQVMYAYYKKYKQDWIKAVLLDKDINVSFNEASVGVVKRRLQQLLNISMTENGLEAEGVFSQEAGMTTINDITSALEEGTTVIVDTSTFSGHVELLIASLVTTEIYRRYRNYAFKGILKEKPVIGVILEEAPRVLGREVLETGPNIFSTIAREGRKFNVGLVAITQMPSLIPKQVLANINTKIILGMEMNSERQALIESAAHDLSQDSRNIASLDKGEALVSSTFSKFPIPLAIPFFDDRVKEKQKIERNFSGVKLS